MSPEEGFIDESPDFVKKNMLASEKKNNTKDLDLDFEIKLSLNPCENLRAN